MAGKWKPEDVKTMGRRDRPAAELVEGSALVEPAGAVMGVEDVEAIG